MKEWIVTSSVETLTMMRCPLAAKEKNPVGQTLQSSILTVPLTTTSCHSVLATAYDPAMGPKG